MPERASLGLGGCSPPCGGEEAVSIGLDLFVVVMLWGQRLPGSAMLLDLVVATALLVLERPDDGPASWRGVGLGEKRGWGAGTGEGLGEGLGDGGVA